MKNIGWQKHAYPEAGENYWKFDDDRIAKIPIKHIREKIVQKKHIESKHRAECSVYYELKSTRYWPGMKEDVKKIVKECEMCKKFNRKRNGGVDFVSTTRPGEKLALVLVEIDGK